MTRASTPARAAMVAALAALSLGSGFRGNGSGHFPASALPERLEASTRMWTTGLESWSNASPVPVGDLVCTTGEPTDLICVDARTGAIRWRAHNQVVDTQVGVEQPTLRATLEDLQRRATELPALQAEQSELRRALRKAPTDTAIGARLQDVGARILTLQADLETWRRYLTPADKEQIGYATPTPVTDGSSLWALFGNGVLSRFRLDGTRTWSVWLGEPPPSGTMHGYTYGTTTSPLLVDGVLVVGYGTLSGYDPATGARLWQGPEWREFGTPAVVQVAGKPVLVTPLGDVVRPKDGKVLASGLGEVWFTSPVAIGAQVWFAGGRTSAHLEQHGLEAWRVTLSPTPEGGVKATRDWRVSIPSKERMYASPVVANGVVHLVDDLGRVFSLDADTGAPLGPPEGRRIGLSGVYPSPVATRDHVVVGSESGTAVRLAADGSLREIHRDQVEGFRAAPVIHGGRVYVRTLTSLTAWKLP